MDWNSDGEWDIVSGDREGYFNVYVMRDTVLEPHLQYPLMDLTILDVGYNSQPAVVDWNGDGKKDLLLGTEEGYVRFYENQTFDTWPMFLPFDSVEAAGQPIFLNRVNPYVFDLDQDGVRDLICGANDGYVRFYRNLGTNAEPRLAAEETLKTVTGVPIQPVLPYYYGSRCGFGDWNNDSLPDFLISGYEGMIELYLGAHEVAVQESHKPQAAGCNPGATVVRGSVSVTAPGVLLDITGQRRATLQPGRNELEYLPAGVYIVQPEHGGRAGSRRIVLSH